MKKTGIAAFGAATLAVTALFTWGTIQGAGAEEIMGNIVREDVARIYAADQPGVKDEVVIGKVVVPRDSWVVVHADKGMGMPGERLGYARVKAGTTENVRVKIEGKVTERLLVAPHADRGVKNKFEFDMEDMERSSDRPYYINRHEVATSFVAAEFGVKADKGAAAVEAEAQPGAKKVLTVKRAVAPTDSWVVVHLEGEDGMPGDRVGLARIPAGENKDVKVELDAKAKLTDNLLVAVHADGGEAGEFEFDMMDRTGKPDQPFFVDGMEVATKVRIVEFGIDAMMGEAAIEAKPQMGATSEVTIDRAVTPENAFVVVHLEGPGGMPGARVGYTPITKGENRDVKVQLDPKVGLKANLIAAIHVDRGEPGKLNFDMDKAYTTPDQPFFVDGMEVATVIPIGTFGVPAEMGEAEIEAEHQFGAKDSVVIDRVVAPTGAWVVVHAMGEMGMPGERVGLERIEEGESTDVRVKLTKPAKLTEKLIVAVHADRGQSGEFEFDMDFGVTSPDQPFFVDGMEVAKVFEIR